MVELIEVRVVFASGIRSRSPETLRVEAGTSLRVLLHQLGLPVEGCALFWEGESVPTDQPLERSGELEVVSTFSGG
ncbi:MAG: hypothetical protein KGJ23_15780 [Euryarchaeota archaeon]|nr:hypothetical protein [Euryarchaeota archaeon]MDE1838058.1 hypothetical protein [Euryarchaeota archaeon]MDE2046577.1 hypothetical protein [Thermoplasmata archaeon]